MEGKFSIGIDYGTESGRAVLISLDSGEEVAEHVTPYEHGVITDCLPNTSVELPENWALQHPNDYIDVITKSIPAIIKKGKVDPKNIVGVGVDFTSCTMMPIDKKGVPLCLNSDYNHDPHSWVKLWKHHSAQKEANKINQVASERNESFLKRYGGKISSEWMIPKIWQVYEEAEQIYNKADRFIEAVDWVVFKLTNNITRNSCSAGYKSTWHKDEGYPSADFLENLAPDLKQLTSTKLRGEIYSIGTKAGEITQEIAKKTGLEKGTAVSVGIIDAHASMPAMGAVTPGKMAIAMGTSICHMLLTDKEYFVEGISGIVEDGIIPGYYAYEAGQPAGGDMLAWYINKATPKYVVEKARKENISVHNWLEKEAACLQPGQSGVLALDWWNGNRSTLVDANLSGVIIGLNLQTKPEEIYRSLLESLAFGTRKIIETFQKEGISIEELYVCGGLPKNNKLLMQILADITTKEIKVADSHHTSALGAAMYGAVAAGKKKGGYKDIEEASQKMARIKSETYIPNNKHIEIYNQLYNKYQEMYSFFGEQHNVMKELKLI